MKYVKNSENYIRVPENYNQCFIRDNFAPVNKNVVMQMKTSGVIDNDDLKIVEFIYRVGFATLEQLVRFCEIKGIIEPKSRINSLTRNMIMSDFVFTDIENYKGAYPPDIKPFYCLQEGGRYLLEQYADFSLVEWEQAYNCRSSRNVGKAIILTEIYLDLAISKQNLLFYTRNPFYVFKKYSLKGGATYGFTTNNGSIYALVDIIRQSETLDGIREKLRRYESLLSTKIWKHYYYDSKETPMFIVVTDNDETALALAREIAVTKIPAFLVSTDERLLRGASEMGAFLKYNQDEDVLYETSYFNF